MAKSDKKAPRKRAKQNRLKHSDVPFKGGKQSEENLDKPQAQNFRVSNEWWKLRSKHGRDKLFASPELMWEAAVEYFKWCDENPLFEQRISFGAYGQVTYANVAKVRAYTYQGLCRYLGCNTEYFRNFKNQKRTDGQDFSSIIKAIEEVIYQQKFEAAAADLLNANIISRDLGLADTTKVDLATDRKLVSDLFPTDLDDDEK